MISIERIEPELFLSELYAADCPDAVLLTEYPSSNSDATQFQNRSKYIIHDPTPPPRRELLKVLGPHHLMLGWGRSIPVCSDQRPPQALLDHWQRVFGDDGVPRWRAPEHGISYITLFPHQSLASNQQVIQPDVNYRLHSKEVIEKIDCLQAEVLDHVEAPCILKLTHGYAGLSNFLIRKEQDADEVLLWLNQKWPNANFVINSIIEDIQSDVGVQFYLRKNGAAVWLGFTQQNFDASGKWSGGCFSAVAQQQRFGQLSEMIRPAAEYLHGEGYFGVVGIDIVTNDSGESFLVDVNPRLTGITPFLMASRMFATEGLGEGIYLASCRFAGSLAELIDAAEAQMHSGQNSRVVVLSAFEEAERQSTICHLSVTSQSQVTNQSILRRLIDS